MRLRRVLPAPCATLSDILRHNLIPAGMAGLRHKSRHNFLAPSKPLFWGRKKMTGVRSQRGRSEGF